MKERIFKLERDRSHLLDMDFDASLIPFPEQESIGYTMDGVDNVPLPSILCFRANFNVVPKKTDYPIVDLTIQNK
jgi:hypothetical protein